MITIQSSDSCIWHIESCIIQIQKELNDKGQVTIDLNREGPCANALGLYDILDQIVVPGDQVKILTYNQLEHHSKYKIKIFPSQYIETTHYFLKTQTYSTEKQIKKTFGLFVGRSNWPRLFLTQHIYNNYAEQSELTFHYDPRIDFHTAHLGLDQLVLQSYQPGILNRIQNLLDNAPLTFDQINEYPVVTPANYAISKLYPNFFLEIVCETYFTGQTFYPTEKIFRPIALKTPFIVQGPINYLKNLKKLGFKTFDQWWSEEYDNAQGAHQLLEITSLIDQLACLSTAKLNELYASMRPVLEHNYKLLLSLTEDDFRKAFGYE